MLKLSFCALTITVTLLMHSILGGENTLFKVKWFKMFEEKENKQNQSTLLFSTIEI